MNLEPIIDAIVDVIIFLELSSEEAVDADAAVRVIESIAAHLHRLGIVEREFVARQIAARAKKEWDTDRSAFVAQIPEMFGLN